MSGCGKTHFIEDLKKLVPDVTYFVDSPYIINEVNKDTEHTFTHLVEEGHRVIDSNVIDDTALKLMFQDIEKVRGKVVIEMGRGFDPKGTRDVSYRHFEELLPRFMKDRCVVVRLSCPFARRVERNEMRAISIHADLPNKIGRKLSPESMNRFFKHDDYDVWSLKTNINTVSFMNV